MGVTSILVPSPRPLRECRLCGLLSPVVRTGERLSTIRLGDRRASSCAAPLTLGPSSAARAMIQRAKRGGVPVEIVRSPRPVPPPTRRTRTGERRSAAGTAARRQASEAATEAHLRDAAMGKGARDSTAPLARAAVVASVRAQSAARVVGAARRRLGRRAGASAGAINQDAVQVRCSPLHRVDPLARCQADRRAARLAAPPAHDPVLVSLRLPG